MLDRIPVSIDAVRIAHRILRGLFYDEVSYGKYALKKLRWRQITACSNDMPIVRALFQDISDWFSIQNPLEGNTDPNFYPGTTVRRENLLLRNM